MSSLAIWYLMRASGVVTTVLLTGVLSLGIATTKRWHAGRLPRFVTVALHRNISLLAVVFLAIHVVTAVVDPYAHVGLVSTVVPFTAGRSALWVGLGTISLDLVAALVLSSVLRRFIGLRVWRLIHWAAYLAWPVALLHGLGIGSDSGTLWLQAISGVCVAIVAGVVVWRLKGIGGAPKHLEPQSGGIPGAAVLSVAGRDSRQPNRNAIERAAA